MSAAREVTVPDIGNFKDVPVIEILVRSGDRVAKDAPLIVLESEKATLDVPSPESGIVQELKIGVGDRVSFGSTILLLEATSSESLTAPQMPSTPSAAAKAVTADGVSRPTTAPSQGGPFIAEPVNVVVSRHASHASPSMRRLAREFGIDLSAVRGTGPRGRIVREDLQKFVKSALSAPPASASAGTLGGLQLAPWPQIDFSKFGRIERAPRTRIRRISGTNLTRNSVVIPHVANFEDADITDLDAFRRTLNSEMRAAGSKVTILSFLIKAVASTLVKYPDFNSSLDGDELVLKRYFHIGFAADTPNGLVVPVIRDVDAKGITQIAEEAATLAALARDGKLKPTDMQGGCMTISSLGGIGGTGFTPIINAPEVAILGATRAQIRPVWNGKEFHPRLILPVTLSWDHRVVDGVAAARFLAHLSALLGDFRRVLL